MLLDWFLKKILHSVVSDQIIEIVNKERPWLADDDLDQHISNIIKTFAHDIVDKVTDIIASEQDEIERAIQDLGHKLVDVQSDISELRKTQKLQSISENDPPILDLGLSTHLHYKKKN